MTDQHDLTSQQQLAQALLLEQVKFYRTQLTSEYSTILMQQVIQLVLQHAPNIQLHEVVKLEHIQAVVKRYAFEMQLGAGLLEFIGDVAQKIYIFAAQSPSRLQDVFSDHQFEMWLSKLMELDNVRHYLNHFLKESPSIQQLCQYISTTTLHNKLPKLFPAPEDEHVTRNHRLEWRQKLKIFSYRQQQRLEHRLEDGIARFIQEQLADLSLLSNEDLESLARNVWEDHKDKPLAEYMSQLSPLDVEEFFVMLYEYWKELRQSPFIQEMILYGVKVFYDFYQDESLEDLFDAIGLEETDLLNESIRFYPKVIEALDQHGILEPLLTLVLQPFYQQESTLNVIEQHLQKT